jgi:hypothetical protein
MINSYIYHAPNKAAISIPNKSDFSRNFKFCCRLDFYKTKSENRDLKGVTLTEFIVFPPN